MAWIYLQALEDSPSHSTLGSGPWHIVKEIDIARVSYCRECNRAIFLWLQFGTTLRPYVPKCCRKSISSTGDFPAKTSRLRDMERACRESGAAYSLRSSGLLAIFDPDSYSWKTSQASLIEDSTEYVRKFPNYGMTLDGECYPLTTWGHRILEKDGFCLPTPTAQDYGSNGHGVREGKQKSKPSLGTMARKNLWPTPSARDWKGGKKDWSKRKRNGKPRTLGDQTLPDRASPGGQLNPEFVEWLMGYRIGWTELNASVTPWYQSRRGRRSKG